MLELPCDQLWMIDARLWTKKRRDEFDQWFIRKFGERKIDRLIISHFHYDHIHSVQYIIRKYAPAQVVITNSLIHSTKIVERTLYLAKDYLHILPDEEITKFGSLEVQLHRTDRFSNIGSSTDPNDHSISVMLKLKDEPQHKFAFLSGDMQGTICNELLNTNFCMGIRENLNVIYKVSHHGSRTGYDDNFFAGFIPQFSIISCGQHNRFNHPHNPPLGKLNRRKTTVTWRWGQYSRCYELKRSAKHYEN